MRKRPAGRGDDRRQGGSGFGAVGTGEHAPAFPFALGVGCDGPDLFEAAGDPGVTHEGGGHVHGGGEATRARSAPGIGVIIDRGDDLCGERVAREIGRAAATVVPAEGFAFVPAEIRWSAGRCDDRSLPQFGRQFDEYAENSWRRTTVLLSLQVGVGPWAGTARRCRRRTHRPFQEWGQEDFIGQKISQGTALV